MIFVMLLQYSIACHVPVCPPSLLNALQSILDLPTPPHLLDYRSGEPCCMGAQEVCRPWRSVHSPRPLLPLLYWPWAKIFFCSNNYLAKIDCEVSSSQSRLKAQGILVFFFS